MTMVEHLLLLLSLLPMFAAGIKVMSGVDHVGSSSSSSRGSHSSSAAKHHQQQSSSAVDAIAFRKEIAAILGRPGSGRPRRPTSVDTTIDRMISEKPGAYLYAMLMSQYNVDALPVNSTKLAVDVRLLLKLTQIVDVDEKNQIMTTNVWLRHEWHDDGLIWDPKLFGGIETLYIPCEEIWLPDTILYNNADGDYQITIQTKVEVRYDGSVVWEPPAIYKSFCAIDVEFFPYDAQLCEMKFGPWTFDVSKVDYFLMNSQGNVSSHDEMAVDMSGFYESVEWDVLKIAGFRRVFQYPCCEERYVDITYHFNIRRKTLFYTINLIIPCVMISFLTVLVFYLPCQSGEKVALSISTLLSLTWFILLLSEIIPPTSLALPLMGKYLLFTMILVTLSIALSVLVLYNHFRHPYAYAMPYWVRYVFLQVLPKIMFYQAIFDENDSKAAIEFEDDATKLGSRNNNRARQSRNSVIYHRLIRSNDLDDCADSNYVKQNLLNKITPPLTRAARSPYFVNYHTNQHQSTSTTRLTANYDDIVRMRYGALLSCHEEGEFIINEALPAIDTYMNTPQVQEAIKCIHFISGRYRSQNVDAKIKGDWEAVSRVLDRFFLVIFSAASSLGTLGILLRAPSLYDQTPALQATEAREFSEAK